MKKHNKILQLGVKTLSVALAALIAFTSNAKTDAMSDQAFLEKNKIKERASEVLFWTQEERSVGFKNIGNIAPTRVVSASKSAIPMVLKDIGLADVQYEVDGKKYSINDFVKLNSAIGLVVLKDGKLVFEDYTEGNDFSTRWISFSVTKSVSSLLIGAAIKDGYIGSIDDHVVDYLPQLKGSAYEGVNIKNVLNMNSGVQWNEDYSDPKSDVSLAGGSNGIALMNYIRALPRAHKPGTVFNYNTAESNLIGELLRSAIGNNAATYLQDKIWQPYGMEADALWLLDRPNGVETGGCCLLATLRDFARIGQFALEQLGSPQNSPLVTNWMKESVVPSVTYPGYGYQWWLNTESSDFQARGIFGQYIEVFPALGLIIAKHGNTPNATGPSIYKTHSDALNQAIVARLQ